MLKFVGKLGYSPGGYRVILFYQKYGGEQCFYPFCEIKRKAPQSRELGTRGRVIEQNERVRAGLMGCVPRGWWPHSYNRVAFC